MATTTTRSVSFHTPQDSLRQAALKKNMSITQTYYLAHKARAKLSREAAQPDHDLRLLVGHANLLDTLMMELADAEREQERWFNQSVASSNSQKQQIHISESIPEEEYDSDSSDDDYDEDEDTVMTNTPSLRPVASKPAPTTAMKYIPHADEEEMTEDNLEEDYAQLELVRTHSHSSPPPELVDESDSSDDESMPPSPPQPHMPMREVKGERATESESGSLFQGGLYLSQQSDSTAISVY